MPRAHPYQPVLARRLPLLVIVLGLLAAACGQQAEPVATGEGTDDTATAGETDPVTDAESTHLEIAYVPATTGLLLHVAQEQGFFAEHGLDVTLTPASNISDIPPTLGQQFDIALGTATDLIRAADAGLDVVQVLGNTISTEDNPFVQLIAPADSGIDGITDLAGKRVASPTLSGVIHIATLYWAEQEGVDITTIEGVQVPPPNLADQLTAGQVDAVEALEPAASQLLANGNVSLGDPFAAIGLPLATNFWIANGEWAREHPEAIEAFRAALEQALEFVVENEPQARSTLQEFTGLPPQVADNVPLPTFELDIRAEDLEAWIQVLEEVEGFEGDVSADELIFAED